MTKISKAQAEIKHMISLGMNPKSYAGSIAGMLGMTRDEVLALIEEAGEVKPVDAEVAARMNLRDEKQRRIQNPAASRAHDHEED